MAHPLYRNRAGGWADFAFGGSMTTELRKILETMTDKEILELADRLKMAAEEVMSRRPSSCLKPKTLEE